MHFEVVYFYRQLIPYTLYTQPPQQQNSVQNCFTMNDVSCSFGVVTMIVCIEWISVRCRILYLICLLVAYHYSTTVKGELGK